MIKITGLDELQEELKDAQKALAALDGDLATITFDPHDPGSIEGAIQQIERVIDDRVGEHARNGIIGPLVEEMKVKYREAILEKAAAARLQSAEA